MNAASRKRAARAAKKKRARARKTIEKAEVILACAGKVTFNGEKMSLRIAQSILRDPTETRFFADHDVNEKQDRFMRDFLAGLPQREGSSAKWTVIDDMIIDNEIP